MTAPQSWHQGEEEAQEARGFADDLWGAVPPYEAGLNPFYALFFSQLELIPIAALDSQGRPWASIVSNKNGKLGYVRPMLDRDERRSKLVLTVPVPEEHPLRFALEGGATSKVEGGEKKLMASVGVMLHNRRRNKLSGWIESAEAGEGDLMKVVLGISNTMGNCPKYINKRNLTDATYEPKVLAASSSQLAAGEHLPSVALEILAASEYVYLATKHTGTAGAYPLDESTIGCNARGGRRGFVRHFFDAEKNRPCLVLPDYSGNRFLQSIGNLTRDKVAGLAIPHFGFKRHDGTLARPSRVLHVTGTTEVLVGEKAAKLMRGVPSCIKIWVDAYTVLESALPVVVDGARPLGAPADTPIDELTEDETIEWSPYNPPLRLLNSEQANSALAAAMSSGTPRKATLEDVDFWTPFLATFHWSCDLEAGSYVAGQYTIMDCKDLLETRLNQYRHMAPGSERELNDDGVRSWTISSAPKRVKGKDGKEKIAFSTTIRRKQFGAATPGLFHAGWVFKSWQKAGAPAGKDAQLQLPLLAFDGSFTLPKTDDPLRLLYFANGIGLTPLLGHIEDLAGSGKAVDITLILALKHYDTAVMDGLIRRSAKLAKATGNHMRLHLVYIERPGEEKIVFSNVKADLITPFEPSVDDDCITTTKLGGRIDSDFFLRNADVLKPEDLGGRATFICGTKEFEAKCRQALKQVAAKAQAPLGSIVSESFSF